MHGHRSDVQHDCIHNSNLIFIMSKMNDTKKDLNELTAQWLHDCRTLLSITTEPVGTLLPTQLGQADALVIVVPVGSSFARSSGSHPAHKRVLRTSAEGTQPKPGLVAADFQTLDAQEILSLVNAPLRGIDLDRVFQRINHSAHDEHLGQRLHAELTASLAKAAQGSDYSLEDKLVELADKDAQVRGGLIGRCIKQPAADGYAHYQVTAERGSVVRVQHLHVCDGYSVRTWGSDAWVERSFIESLVTQQDNMKRLFGRKP